MSLLPLIPDTDPRLHQPSEPVRDVADVVGLAHDMLRTMYHHKGIGLAAPQVGHNIRLIVIDCSVSDMVRNPFILINPEILSREGEIEVEEGCLSFPGMVCKVKRAFRVTVKADTLEKKGVTFVASGIAAVCIQHEIDHLDGITFDQRSFP